MSNSEIIQQIIDMLNPLTDIARFAIISNVACFFCFNCGRILEDNENVCHCTNEE